MNNTLLHYSFAGKNRGTLVETNMLNPVGLVVYGNYVYWIDRESRNVMRINKKGEDKQTAIQTAIEDLSDITLVDTSKTTGRRMYHCLN